MLANSDSSLFFFVFKAFDVDIVSDGLARRMKGIVEASRKAALRQRDAGIAPPKDESDEGTLENLPEGDDEEGVPDYVP